MDVTNLAVPAPGGHDKARLGPSNTVLEDSRSRIQRLIFERQPPDVMA